MHNTVNRRRGGGGNKGASKAAVRSKTVKPSILEGGLHSAANLAAKTRGGDGGQSSTNNLSMIGGSITANTKNVDLLVIGAGPAALGLMVAAVKQQKFGELL